MAYNPFIICLYFGNLFYYVYFQRRAAVTIPSFPDKGIQKLKWDPVGHKLAYVHDFNVYVVTVSYIRIWLNYFLSLLTLPQLRFYLGFVSRSRSCNFRWI